MKRRVCLTAGVILSLLPAGRAAAQTEKAGEPVVFAGLRPTDDAYRETAIGRMAAAQRLRVLVENVTAIVSGREVIGHDQLVSELGSDYLVDLFDCRGELACSSRVLQPLRRRGITRVVLGDFAVQGDIYRFRVRLVRIDTARVERVVSFSLASAELEDPKKWGQHIGPMFANRGSVRIVTNHADAFCTVDGEPCQVRQPGALVLTLKAGKHIIELRKEGFRPARQVIVVVPGLEIEVSLTLEEVPANAPGPVESGAVAYDPAAAPRYRALRTDEAPVIDGALADRVWRKAPSTDRFFEIGSSPYGQPAVNPTAVQVAYDQRALYIGFTLDYAEGGAWADAIPTDETHPFELATVYVDYEHDQASALAFGVSPLGYLFDWEIYENGARRNYEWTGRWTGKARPGAKGWTAEFELPWSTLRMRPRDGEFTVGINFGRFMEPGPVTAVALWSLPPPGNLPVPAYFGQLEGLRQVSRGDLLILQPYGIVAYNADLPSYRYDVRPGFLRDFDGDTTPIDAYGGIYGRLQPGFGLRADFVVNPDFSQVRPDAAVANLDRFELFFPELREFFVETVPNFAFGQDRYQIFYSRRIGLRRRLYGFDEVPILFGAHAVYRRAGTSVALMNVTTDELDGPVERGLDTSVDLSHVTVLRARHTLGASYAGAIGMNRTQPYDVNEYSAGGLDGKLSLLKDHLVVSGFLLGSSKLEWVDALAGPIAIEDPQYKRLSSLAGSGSVAFTSQDFVASASYLDVGDDFRADLGFFDRIGVRRSEFNAMYRPVVQNDLVRAVRIGASVVRLLDRRGDYADPTTDDPLLQRLTTSIEAVLQNRAFISLSIGQNTDWIDRTFYVAGARMGISPGRYEGLVTTVSFLPAPWGRLQAGGSYQEGYFFGGYQRVLSPEFQLLLDRFALRLLYQQFYIRPGPLSFTQQDVGQDTIHGARVSAQLLYAPLPDLRLSANVEGNTLDETAVTQLVATWRLDGLTSLAFVANRSGPGLRAWERDPIQQVLVKFQLGFGVF